MVKMSLLFFFLPSSNTYFISVLPHIFRLPLTYICLDILVIGCKSQSIIYKCNSIGFFFVILCSYEVREWKCNLSGTYLIHKDNFVSRSLSPSFYLLYLTGWPGDQPPCRPHTEQLLPLAVHPGRQRGPTPRPRHPPHRTRHLLLEEWALWHSWYIFNIKS